jgi:DNA modification methylase
VTPFFASSDVTIYQADSREAWRHLPEHSADALICSPPYWGLRDYGVDGQIGLEDDPTTYIGELADLLTGYGERVMKPGGSLWLNLGDTYSSGSGNPSGGMAALGERLGTGGGHKIAEATISRGQLRGIPPKCLLMIPERVALALIARGWILRNKVVWAKPNGMPSSVQDRLATKWEYVFHLVRQPRYHYDLDAIKVEPGEGRNPPATKQRKYAAMQGGKGSINEHGWEPGPVNPGDVWQIATQPYPDAHFAVYPPELIRRPILATVPEGGTVLDPFFGSGTTGVMARKLGRKCIGVELNPDYCQLAADRFRQDVLVFDEDGAA